METAVLYGCNKALLELRDAVISFNKQGRVVKLDGLGTYISSINLEGTIKVSHHADRALKNALNMQSAFRGDIINRENIGKPDDDLVAMWNADNPENVVS